MKRIFIAITILVLVLPAMRQAEAGTDVSLNFFYDNLGSDGSWVEVADYGYCWQPNVAVSSASWRPYADGYWAYTDVGWTWVSYEDFGWATYHYGRWVRLHGHGWFWVPGREWGPAWVSWRTGGDYVGWAPLPPHRHGEVAYENRPIGVQVDLEFDIGPAWYNFVDVRYIGEPVLRERIFAPSLNVTYITNTVNVTNITYTNSTVYNYGPDYDRLNRYSTRPIRRMTLEHDANTDLSAAIKSKEFTRVQGDKLLVAAPLAIQKSPQPIAPKTVKEKIVKPKFERGWTDVSDPKVEEELKQKMKNEDPKSVPPPTVKPRENTETAKGPPSDPPATGTTPAVATGPAPAVNPVTSTSPTQLPDKGKGKHGENTFSTPNGVSSEPGSSPLATPPGKHQKERDEKPVPSVNDDPKRTPRSLTTSPDGTPYREPSLRDQGLKRNPPYVPGPKNKRTENVPDFAPAPPPQPADVLTEKPPRKLKDAPAPSNREAPPDFSHKRPLPPERVVPPDVPQMRPVPPERVAPPNHEAPPDAPRKRPLPPERVAPPPGPAANGPAKTEAPRNKRGPDKKADEAPPPPGQ